jgi:hypothetical protein
MSLARYRAEGQPQQKIRAEHLDRAAAVYVRQSSRQQVLEHTESTRLQYALAGRAVALGWARSQVTVIDDDLGVSAATADSRKGVARLVAEVTMGRAGVVLGIEMSRLARTGRDWHQLLELCCLSGRLTSDDVTQDRLDIRGYIDTARKHGKNAMDVLYQLMLGTPWRPPAQAFSP